MQGYSYDGEIRLGHWFILAPIGIGNGPHVLGNGPHVLGNGPHVLGNGPHLFTQFMNAGLFL